MITVKIDNAIQMYESFKDIFQEFAPMCDGFSVFNWDDKLRKIIVHLKEMGTKILFSVRKDDESGLWTQYSALLIPKEE